MMKKDNTVEFCDYLCYPVTFIIVSIIMITIGILEIKYPDASADIDANYLGSGKTGFILIVFMLIFRLTWGKITGILLISLGIICGYYTIIGLIAYAREKQQDKDEQKISSLVKKVVIGSAKNYLQRKRNN